MVQSLAADSGCAASLCIMCNAVVQGLRNESGEHFVGSLMDYDTLSATSHPCPMDVVCKVWGFTAGLVCVSEYGCSLPLTRDYTIHPKPLLHPSVGGESV